LRDEIAKITGNGIQKNFPFENREKVGTTKGRKKKHTLDEAGRKKTGTSRTGKETSKRTGGV